MEKVPGKIQKLDQRVIDRIAAGEVIQRPANALKELMENALDAGAKEILIIVKAGGLKLLQIQDDGSGILEEDLPIVCERFTTSKLSKYEDLMSIGTYGFRGEALASISHVAHLAIITKTANSPCAFRAEYVDGRLKEYEDGGQNPKRCAGKQGTSIIVEDLFYNMEVRRKALRNPNEEHAKIADVVTKYAIHNHMVGFSLKKYGETMTEVRTPAKSSVLDNIKILYGGQIARELLSVSTSDETILRFSMSGYISNFNYSMKKSVFILFINHRLVESQALKKSIEAIYSNYLPKGTHPFVYIAMDIEPRNVDVNVHPTKHEVHFLHEDAIISNIGSAVENLLLGANESRTFLVQSLLPGASGPNFSISAVKGGSKRKTDDDRSPRTDPKEKIRTDPKLQKLDRFLCSTPDPDKSGLQSFQDSPSRLQGSSMNVDRHLIETYSEPVNSVINNESSKPGSRPVSASAYSSVSQNRERREIKLKSVRSLKEEIRNKCHSGLLEMFRNHTFVGCVDRTLSLFQHDVNLYICNVNKLSKELFYQRLVADFGNFPTISIEEPLQLKDLIDTGLRCRGEEETLESGEQIEKRVDKVYKQLMGKRKMLDDYFALRLDEDGKLISLPLLINNYFPDMEGLVGYILNIAEKVDWTNEKNCFHTFCDVTAQFYAVPVGNYDILEEQALNGKSWRWNIEHIIFAEMQRSFSPPNVYAEDSTILQLTSLPELYKVFERC